jgi:hypothetical protein
MLHPVEDVPGSTFFRSLEQEMFHKVRHTLLPRLFIAGAGVDGKTAISHGRWPGSVDDTDAVGKGMSVIVHVFLFFSSFNRQKYNKSHCYSLKNADICRKEAK